jgi:hypothetical protein
VESSELPASEVAASTSLPNTGDGKSSGAPPHSEGRAAMFVRKPGESMQSYLERIDIESRNRIVDCFRKERKKGGRRKQ